MFNQLNQFDSSSSIEGVVETPEMEDVKEVSADTKSESANKSVNANEADDAEEWEEWEEGIPRLPRKLHPDIKAIVEPYPTDRREVMAIMSLPFLGVLGGNACFKYRNNEDHYLGFEACLVGEQSIGKSALTRMKNALISELIKEDREIRQKKDDYDDECLAAGEGEKPRNPHYATRLMMPDTTKSQFNQNLKDLRGKRALIIAPEIDALGRPGNWCADHGVNERLMFDTEEGGQDTKSAQGTSALVPIAVNLVSSGTPLAVFRHYKNAEDGLVTRVAFCSFPSSMDKNAEEHARTAGNLTQLLSIQERLMAVEKGDPIEVPNLKSLMLKWCKEKEGVADASGNKSIEVFRKRSAVMGFRAGCILYLLDGKVLTTQAKNFALWVAEYVLHFQLKYFGDKMNESIQANAEILNAPVASTKRKNWLLVKLPSHFSREQLKAQYEMDGKKGTGYRSLLKRLCERGWIVQNSDGTYTKTPAGEALSRE